MPGLTHLLAILLGGGIGAVLRLVLSAAVQTRSPVSFPGSFLIGIFAAGLLSASTREPERTIWMFAVTGLLGGFTTFSSFSLETVILLRDGATRQALLYAGISPPLCIGAAAAWWLGARCFPATG